MFQISTLQCDDSPTDQRVIFFVSIRFNAILRKTRFIIHLELSQDPSTLASRSETMSYMMYFFLKQGAVLKQVYITRVIWKPASALSLPLSSHSRADTAITPAVFLLSVLMYSRGSPEARLFICIPPGFGPAGFVLIGEISSHEIQYVCVLYSCLVCFYVIVCACYGQQWPLIKLVAIQQV